MGSRSTSLRDPAGVRDLARRLGVNPSSVSRALSGKAGVSAGLRAQVLALARGMHYAPNPHASSLRRGRGQGAVLITGYSQSRIAMMRNQALVALGRPVFGGIGVMVRMPDESLDEVMRKAAAGHPGAIVLADTAPDAVPSPALVEHLAARQVAVVAMDQAIGALDQVRIRRGIGTYQAARLFALAGCRKPLFFSAATVAAPDGRLAGIQAAFAALGLTLDPADVIPIPAQGGYDHACGYAMTRDLLASRAFDGLFCYNDEMAVGALRALADAGVRVPEEVKVVGFDDLPLADYATPRLTTVAQPVEEVARATLALVERRLAEPDAPPRVETFETRLVVRESAAPASRAGMAEIIEVPETIRQQLQ